jgi:hypothetical protein
MRIALYIFTAAYAYYSFRHARRTGEWSWSRLFILLGATAVYIAAFVIPIVTSKLFETHFNLMFSIMMAGNVAFVGTFIYLYRKPPFPTEAAAPSSAISTEQQDISKASVLAFALLVLCASPAQAQGVYKDPSGFNSIEHSLRLLAVSAPAQSSAPSHGNSRTYRDPQGRYTLAVPAGWSVTPPSDAGSGTVQLSSGPSWAMLMPSSGGEPRDVNHQVTQQIQAQFKDFQLLNEGDLQVNGHPSHGTTATGINPKGARVSVLVLSINAGSGHYLTVISSSPNDQAKSVNATVMQMAQSIRFGGEGE